MLITIPGTLGGRSDVASVLDLEPLLEFVRQCRPDAVSLMPPTGADDQPNGAALTAMKDLLLSEGLQVVGGTWTVPAAAPVREEAWLAEQGFVGRTLLAALGEAGVGPLILRWEAAFGEAEQPAFRTLMENLLEEAERSQVPVAVCLASEPERISILEGMAGRFLGAAADLHRVPQLPDSVPLLAVRSDSELGMGPSVTAPLRALRQRGYAGPLLLDPAPQIALACGVGSLRGILAGL